VASASDDALANYRARRARMVLLCTLMTAGLAGAYALLARMHAEGVARTEALSRARADLQALNTGLDKQVQERTAQLEQAYRDLETFSYAVAHDVRAPLAGISGFADALQPLVDGAGNDKQQHYLRRIKANAAHMDELTLGLLELGRLSRAPLARGPVDLTALAHEVVAGLRESDAARQVEVDIEPGLSAHGDRALLRQVLENLLGNAWKFSSRRPQARIAFGREREGAAEAQAVFSVNDNGEGFDNVMASRLFQPFSRLHRSGEFPGSGLGLATVRRIVVLHGGEVWCRARPGAGATFFFSLPVQGA
jgi:signal transduction histidine kinase